MEKFEFVFEKVFDVYCIINQLHDYYTQINQRCSIYDIIYWNVFYGRWL